MKNRALQLLILGAFAAITPDAKAQFETKISKAYPAENISMRSFQGEDPISPKRDKIVIPYFCAKNIDGTDRFLRFQQYDISANKIIKDVKIQFDWNEQDGQFAYVGESGDTVAFSFGEGKVYVADLNKGEIIKTLEYQGDDIRLYHSVYAVNQVAENSKIKYTAYNYLSGAAEWTYQGKDEIGELIDIRVAPNGEFLVADYNVSGNTKEIYNIKNKTSKIYPTKGMLLNDISFDSKYVFFSFYSTSSAEHEIYEVQTEKIQRVERPYNSDISSYSGEYVSEISEDSLRILSIKDFSTIKSYSATNDLRGASRLTLLNDSLTAFSSFRINTVNWKSDKQRPAAGLYNTMGYASGVSLAFSVNSDDLIFPELSVIQAIDIKADTVKMIVVSDDNFNNIVYELKNNIALGVDNSKIYKYELNDNGSVASRTSLKLNGDDYAIRSIALSAAGDKIAVGLSAGKIYIYDRYSASLVDSLIYKSDPMAEFPINNLRFSKDGKYLYGGPAISQDLKGQGDKSDSYFICYDIANKKLRDKQFIGDIKTNANRIVSLDNTEALSLDYKIQSISGSAIALNSAPTGKTVELGYSYDDKLIFYIDAAGKMQIWDKAKNINVFKSADNVTFTQLAISNVGETIAYLRDSAGTKTFEVAKYSYTSSGVELEPISRRLQSLSMKIGETRELTLNGEYREAIISAYDESGASIDATGAFVVNENKLRINTNNMRPGAYIVSVAEGGKKENIKIIIGE
jgi:WD40 repeat protein